MAKIFCPNCGAKSEYQFAAPNFCSKCGSSYSSKKNSLTDGSSSEFKNSNEQDDQSNYDDENFEEDGGENFFSNSNRVPKISKLNVEIDYSSDSVKVIKFSDLINQETPRVFPKGRIKNLNE